MSDKIQIRRGTAAQLAAITLSTAEMAFITDTNEFYVGNGSSNVQIKFRKSGSYGFKSSGNQSVSASTATKITFDGESYDYLSEYDTTVSRFTAKQVGLYVVNAGLYVTNPTDQSSAELRLYKNGALFLYLSVESLSGITAQLITGIGQVPLAVGDYIEIYGLFLNAINISAGLQLTYFQVSLLQGG